MGRVLLSRKLWALGTLPAHTGDAGPQHEEGSPTRLVELPLAGGLRGEPSRAQEAVRPVLTAILLPVRRGEEVCGPCFQGSGKALHPGSRSTENMSNNHGIISAPSEEQGSFCRMSCTWPRALTCDAMCQPPAKPCLPLPSCQGGPDVG